MNHLQFPLQGSGRFLILTNVNVREYHFFRISLKLILLRSVFHRINASIDLKDQTTIYIKKKAKGIIPH